MTTINKEEIQKFSNLADEWWDVNGKFKPLHMFCLLYTSDAADES